MQDTLFDIIVHALVFLTAIPVHEAAHAWVAYKLGDPTAKYNGRLTLNPMAHFDVLGTICLLIMGVGWARPVPVNSNNFKNKKVGMCLTALAGPVSNLIIAFFTVILAKVCYYSKYHLGIYELDTLSSIFLKMAIVNVTLAVFNMIPIPPFDGSRIFGVILPKDFYFKIMKYEQIIMVIVLVIFLSGAFSVPLAMLQNVTIDFLFEITRFVDLIMVMI